MTQKLHIGAEPHNVRLRQRQVQPGQSVIARGPVFSQLFFQHLAHGIGHVFGREAKMLEEYRRRRAHASLALGLCRLLGVPTGDAILLMVLAASASYIAVPAVMRYAIPEANPSIYFGLSLGITFPLNILFGIPLYTYVAKAVLA